MKNKVILYLKQYYSLWLAFLAMWPLVTYYNYLYEDMYPLLAIQLGNC